MIQSVEVVNGTPVYWSLGNEMAVASRTGPVGDLRTLDGLLALVTFVERPDGTFRATARAVLLCEDVVSRVVYPALATLLEGEVSPAWHGGSGNACSEVRRCWARPPELSRVFLPLLGFPLPVSFHGSLAATAGSRRDHVACRVYSREGH